MSAAEAFESTLIRRGLQATTISELTRFVATMDARPLDRLLDELPALAEMSTSKFDLARAVFRRRARQLDPVEREQLRMHSEEVAARQDVIVAERIRTLFS
jgi:hypothetical protein